MNSSVANGLNLAGADLKKNIRGEVYLDQMSLGMYSTDASLYQIDPLAVVVPKDEEDVKTAIAIAGDHNLPILPRGGGTSLAGQTVGRALILDFSKYMNQILEFNEDEKWVRVQPGTIRDQLNTFLAPYGLIFSPDPATSSRANIGGMIGNNSSGTKSILYGKTIDHVLELKVMLSNGEILELKSLTRDEYAARAEEDTFEGHLYKEIREVINNNSADIEENFPKVMRRVSGYSLDEFTNGQDWNLAKLICGSEGTLATILEAKVNLDLLPKKKSVCLAHFEDLMSSLRAVQVAVKYKPAAVEILDNELLKLARSNIYTKRLLDVLDGEPDNVLLIEFYGDTYEEIRTRQEEMIAELKQKNLGFSFPIYDEGEAYEKVWNLRKKGLGILLGRTTEAKPLPFIEDSAVPVDVLPEYISDVMALCKKYEVEAAMYAHASVGVIHVRPILNLKLQEDIDKMKRISEETYELVVKYGGSWSGEHGDGLVRSYKNREFFGEKIYGAFKDIKKAFDPNGLMNPGKILDAPPMDQDLRYGTGYQDEAVDTHFHFRKGGSFESTVHLCSGVGECRKMTGTMCPSFHATQDEEHSTRGRANALRLVMSGQKGKGDLTDERLLDTLDLCLSCKACKSECPSNVDMAKLKSEVLQKKYDRGKMSLREWFVGHSSQIAQWSSGIQAPFINLMLRNQVVRWVLEKMLKIEKKRVLPSYASQTLGQWYRNQPRSAGTGKKVALFADTYLNYHEPQTGMAAIRLLNKLGYEVELAEVGCCQRPRISNGFLKAAKKDGTTTSSKLKSYLDQNIPVLVCEPSCLSALQDDLPDLVDDQNLADALSNGIMSIGRFVAQEVKSSKVNLPLPEVLYHGHCHQKSLYGLEDMTAIFGDKLQVTKAGCCGMAGSFGYEKEHYDISMKIGEGRLFDQVRESEHQTVADGFSCRHQIEHFTGKKPVHWVESVKLD